MLCFVIPPKTVKSLGNAATLTINELTLQRECFYYQYDERGRLIVKHVPGAAPVFFVYDLWDRPVLSQDGNQRAHGKWSFTKYDALDRVVLKGEITHAGNQASMVQAVMNFYSKISQNPSLRYEDRGKAVHGYTNRSYPVLTHELEVNTVNYYDNYDFLSSPYQFVPEPTLSLTAAFIRVQGLVTGVKNRVLGTKQYLTSVNYYDKRYRLVQVISDNHLKGMDRTSSQYNFTGKVTKEKHVHKAKEQVSITKEYKYDHQDRLLKVYHQVNNESKILIADHHYNELGELTQKNLHVESNGKPWQSLDYLYNIRGWLSTMNKPITKSGALYNDFYAFKLYYNDPSTELHNVRQFNGNVSAFKEERPYEIEDSGSAVRGGYSYTYDPANQLKMAIYSRPSNPSLNGTYNEAITYDQNGNISTLNRKGPIEGITQTIDDLEYHYAGNQLVGVKDRGNVKEGFKDRGQTTDYTYDANGNLISDSNKKIASIHYNILNLPDTITFTDGRAMVYTYDISGRKLKQQVVAANGSVKLERDYVSSFLYLDDTLQEIQHPEGRIVHQVPGRSSSGWEYQYHLKDHLGNVKTTFTTAPQQEIYRASLEEATNAAEAAQFNPTYDRAVRYTSSLYNHTQSGVRSQRLSGANEKEVIGLAKSLQVMPGDTINMEVYAKYFTPTSKSTNVQRFIVAAISSAFGLSASTIGEAGMAYQSLTALHGAGLLLHSDEETDKAAPKAYLNYILFDQDFIPYDLGFDQVSTQALETGKNTPHEKLGLQAIIKRPGYIYMYLSNENATITDVFFDDLQITHKHSPLIATTDYYPFGRIAQQFSRERIVEQRLKYNGKEFQKEEGLDWYDYGARMYDANLGRWHMVDPIAEKYYAWSPYNYVLNNPLKFIDSDGREPIIVEQHTEMKFLEFSFGSDAVIQGSQLKNDKGFSATLIEIRSTLAEVSFEGEKKVQGEGYELGVGGKLVFNSLAGNAEAGVKDGSLVLGAGAEAGTVGVEGEACLLFVCVGGEASFGPQLGAEVAIGEKTKVGAQLGIGGAAASVRFVKPPPIISNDYMNRINPTPKLLSDDPIPMPSRLSSIKMDAKEYSPKFNELIKSIYDMVPF
ncbi:hypothetical protein AHMF7605_29125 [Adhaeribacter arboris]|uniref:RHS repeat-associated core domain-containing protein n=2 Tax=Adhaeribacter arboris TaxID=2072846 RepID=A0A2T2Y923_9BACT|nr:hypothetical protein AHMF7605_29125 [Adhaeribacter arboris]